MPTYIFWSSSEKVGVDFLFWEGGWGTRRFWYRSVNILKVCSKVMVITVVTTDLCVQRQFQTLND